MAIVNRQNRFFMFLQGFLHTEPEIWGVRRHSHLLLSPNRSMDEVAYGIAYVCETVASLQGGQPAENFVRA